MQQIVTDPKALQPGEVTELPHATEGALPCCRRQPWLQQVNAKPGPMQRLQNLQIKADLPMFCRLGACTQR